VLVSFCLWWWKVLLNIIFFAGGWRLIDRVIPTYPLSNYNHLLRTQGASWDQIVLSNLPIIWYEAEQLELIGDILMTESGAHSEIISWYTKSLLYRESVRVREKLRILSASGTEMSEIQMEWEKSETVPRSVTLSSEALQLSDERIDQDEASRWEYLTKPLPADAIRDTIDFLDVGVDRIDW
jgi:hypothetical protein